MNDALCHHVMSPACHFSEHEIYFGSTKDLFTLIS